MNYLKFKLEKKEKIVNPKQAEGNENTQEQNKTKNRKPEEKPKAGSQSRSIQLMNFWVNL